jgi:L-alanine-DL-glutamate epimerase-like enolase superfamily enzyme
MSIIKAIEYRLKTSTLANPFVTSRDEKQRDECTFVEVILTLEKGISVVSEAVAPVYLCGETPEISIDAIKKAAHLLEGMDVLRRTPITAFLREKMPDTPSARATLEIAIWKAIQAVTGIPLWKLWGGAVERVETDITLSASDHGKAIFEQAIDDGFGLFKVKVGVISPEEEILFLRNIYHRKPDARVRLDANQAFTASEAIRFIEDVLETGILLELMEQPVPAEDYEGLDYVSRNSPIPIIADEAVMCASDAMRIFQNTSVQGVNVKLMKFGVQEALDIAAIARIMKKKLMLGCMLESSVNLSVALAMACGTGAFHYIDLDSHILRGDVCAKMDFICQGPWLSPI